MGQREQDGPAHQRPPGAAQGQAAAAGIQHERTGREQGLDLVELQGDRGAGGDASRGRPLQRAACLRDFGDERRDAATVGALVRAPESRSRGSGVQGAQSQFRHGQLRHGGQGRRQAGRVHGGEQDLRLRQAPHQQRTACREQAGVQRVRAVAVVVQRGRSGLQRAGGAAQLAHRQGDFGVGQHAARPRQLFLRAERALRAAQQLACAGVLAQLRHRDAAQRQGGRVVAQRHALERAQCVAGGERPCSSGDQCVHASSHARFSPRAVR